MRQSKTLILSTNIDKKVRNRVFYCHLSPDWRQMAIENSVSNDFSQRKLIGKSVFDCRLSDVVLENPETQLNRPLITEKC